MVRREYTYPSKRVPRPGGDFTVRQFILPVEIKGTAVWAWLDTGANVSILPREIAEDITYLRSTQHTDGEYALAGVVDVPYQSYTFDLDILDYIPNTIPELDLEPYTTDSAEVAVPLTDVEFQTPIMTWPEIADHLTAEPPVALKRHGMNTIILGLHGVLDQLNLSFVADNAVTIGTQV